MNVWPYPSNIVIGSRWISSCGFHIVKVRGILLSNTANQSYYDVVFESYGDEESSMGATEFQYRYALLDFDQDYKNVI